MINLTVWISIDGNTILAEQRYGKQVLEDLSRKLTQHFGKGFSVVNLRQMRVFYLAYSIQQTKISAELKNPLFTLPWSHYLKLMRIENLDERGFYEIECIFNNELIYSIEKIQKGIYISFFKCVTLLFPKIKGIAKGLILSLRIPAYL